MAWAAVPRTWSAATSPAFAAANAEYSETFGLGHAGLAEVTELVRLVKRLCREADETLWAAHAQGPAPTPLGCRLRFPEYRTGTRRTSEQEARFAFASALFALPHDKTGAGYTFAVSVVPCLVAWCALLLPDRATLPVLAASFAVMLAID